MSCGRFQLNAAAFSPVTRLYYVMVTEECDVDMAADRTKSPGEQTPKKYLEAINIEDGKIVWRIRQLGPADGKRDAGILATAGVSCFMATRPVMWSPRMRAPEMRFGTFQPTEKTKPRP
jgi:hypothetical protein